MHVPLQSENIDANDKKTKTIPTTVTDVAPPAPKRIPVVVTDVAPPAPKRIPVVVNDVSGSQVSAHVAPKRIPVTVKDVSRENSHASEGPPKRIPVTVKDVSGEEKASTAIPVVNDVASASSTTRSFERIPLSAKHVKKEAAAAPKITGAASPPKCDNVRCASAYCADKSLAPTPDGGCCPDAALCDNGVVRIPVSVAPLEKKADAKTGSGNLESGADKSDSIQSVAKHLAQQIQEHLKASGAMPSSDTVTESAQTLNHTLKKLMEIEGAIKAQISRVHQQSKELLRISNHRVQKTKVAAKQPDMSVIELAKKFNDLQKRVQSHEQVIGELKKTVSNHIAQHITHTTLNTHTLIRKQPTSAVITGASTAVVLRQGKQCMASPIICSAAAQLAAEIQKHTEYTANLKALQAHVARITK